MAFTKTMTAPLAIIKIDGQPIGKMKSLRITETINRGTVRGIGKLDVDEIPALTWDGSMSCSMYLVDLRLALNNLSNAKVFQRQVQTVEQFIDTVLLNEDGLQIDIFRKVKQNQDPNTGIISTGLEMFASIRGAFCNRESFDISESQLSGRDAEFVYTTPIIFPL